MVTAGACDTGQGRRVSVSYGVFGYFSRQALLFSSMLFLTCEQRFFGFMALVGHLQAHPEFSRRFKRVAKRIAVSPCAVPLVALIVANCQNNYYEIHVRTKIFG